MAANKTYNIDDVGNVNSFLALIGGSQVPSPPESKCATATASESPPVSQPSGSAVAGSDVAVSLPTWHDIIRGD